MLGSDRVYVRGWHDVVVDVKIEVPRAFRGEEEEMKGEDVLFKQTILSQIASQDHPGCRAGCLARITDPYLST